MPRLDPQPNEIIDRRRRISFRFEGKTYSAYEGDTIGSALLASGVEIFSRSFKYHRPRGLLCFSGKCPNCLMNVNGIPNVRVCTEPVHEGDCVTSQHCWPSLQWDMFSWIEKFDFLLPVGFYYKTLFKPRFLWKLAEPIIRRMAGLGTLGPLLEEHSGYEHAHLHTELAVVGGGPAGLAAARAGAEAGIEVVLVDDQPELGGHLRLHQRDFPAPDSGQPKPAYQIALELAGQVRKNPRIQVFNPAVALGGYEGGLLALATAKRLIHLRALQTVVATGSYEYPPLFENNDLPGVMLGMGVLKLIHLYGVKPGRRAVVIASDDEGLEVAFDLSRAGIQVAAVVDQRTQAPHSQLALELKRRQIPHLVSFAPRAAEGRARVRSLSVAPLIPDAGSDPRGLMTFECDLVCLCSHRAPSLELLRQNEGTVRFDPVLNQMVPATLPLNLLVAGHLTGFRDLSIALLQGRIAGLEAADRLQPLEGAFRDQLHHLKAQLKQEEDQYRNTRKSSNSIAGSKQGKQFVCLCEDVTRKDIRLGVEEGFDEMELLKRYTTGSMGPCQGRMCLMPLAMACADETGQTLAKTGTTTSRPPVQSVSLGLLAGPHHHPVKLTPMHHKHLQAGARPMDMGEWKRPHTYTSPEMEWRAVRERVGLIDVSTLGKLELRGRDAARLLDRVYTHVFSSLKVGRIRYGIICGDDGIILDDGTVSRLAEDCFYITTTTGNVEFVERWLDWWIAGTGLCAHVTNVTGDFAAVNLAGPKARDVLRKVTSLDASPAAFKYMTSAQGEVAGVPALLLRIGFVGETGWEIHFPACYGEHLWDALLEAGKEFGIMPFGVEAQRILRLEKKHIIVGQDTDALSNPLEADMEWVVKFEKEDFIGRPGLVAARARGFHNRLVGFVTETLVEEGSAVVVDQKPVGRVTSARLSPGRNRCVGLAWVPYELSADGKSFTIRSNGSTVAARVHQEPFYDPQGGRLKE